MYLTEPSNESGHRYRGQQRTALLNCCTHSSSELKGECGQLGQSATLLKSFITQDPYDRDLLVKNLKPFDIPVLNYTGNRQMQNKPLVVSDMMHNLGITSRLDEVFEAPSAVKEVLISQAALDHSFIGSEETNRRADDANKLGVMDLWTPENHYRWSISRYGGHVSASVNPVQGSRLFASNQRRRKLESMEKEEDLETTISRLTDMIGKLNVQRFKHAIEMKDLLIEVVSLKRCFAEEQLTTVELDMK
ncbi:hypothetical protein KI387_021774, partial [Taxus chinensis]